MDQKVLEYVVAKTRELIDAPTCSSETKASAQKWLDALGTDAEKAEVFRPHSMVSKPHPARASRWRAMRFSSSESEGSIVAQ